MSRGTPPSTARRGPGAVLGGVALLALLPAAAHAQNMTVYVHQGASNAILADATVCVGTEDNRTRYGVKRTNSQGRADFTGIPGSALVVTATKAGYAGQSKTDPASNYSRTVRVMLQPGSGGPICSTPPQVAGRAVITMLAIRSFSLNNNAADVRAGRPVTLWAEWTGATPTHYRASERQDFAGAQWQPFNPSGTRPTYSFGTNVPGEKRLYFQLRASPGPVSGVASDAIRVVRPARQPRIAPCRLEIQRADNALSNDPSPALTEVVEIPAGETRRFNSSWPSPNEKRRGYGMHVRRLRNVGTRGMIAHATFNATLRLDFVSLSPGDSKPVRFDLDRVVCVGDQ